jgi:hypothetical protein
MINTSIADNNPSLPDVHVRRQAEARAMAWNDRLAIRAKRMFSMNNVSKERIDHDNNFSKDSAKWILSNEEDERINLKAQNKKTQFRFEPTETNKTTSLLRSIFLWQRDSSSSDNFSTQFGLGSTFSYYLHCMFREDFFVVIIGMCAAFFALVFGFSVFIAIAGAADNECLIVGGTQYNAFGSGFAEAFGLSWVTFR